MLKASFSVDWERAGASPSFPRSQVAPSCRAPTLTPGTGAGLPTLWQRVMLTLVSPQLIEVQAEYHRKSLTLLQAVLPQIKAQQGK